LHLLLLYFEDDYVDDVDNDDYDDNHNDNDGDGIVVDFQEKIVDPV